MRAVVWHGPRDVRVDTVSPLKIEDERDLVAQVRDRTDDRGADAVIDDLLPLLVGGGDLLDVEDLATHSLPGADAPRGYAMFRAKDDGAINVVLQPALG